jgi:hypothetical protein
LAVDRGARGHVVDAEATLLGEDDIVEAAGLGLREVVLAGEGAVRGRLSRIASEEVALAIEHAQEERGVGGVAVFDDPVEEEPALATDEGDLAAVVSIGNK